MLDKIIYFSIQNKLVVGILTIAIIAWGIWSATQLPIDAVPDITNNQVQIITNSPSLAPPDIERFITTPIETNIAGIPGIEEVRSISRFGLSVITVVFTDETDIYWARQQITERLQTVIQEIPSGMGVPRLMPVTTGLGEIYQYVLYPKKGYENRYTAMDLRVIQDWIVRKQLLGTPGVADVSSFGGYVKQYEVAVDPEKLRAMNISILEIYNALEANNANTGGAYIDKQPNTWFIRTEGLMQSIEDIRNTIVKKTNAGIPVLIRDVAEVRYGHAVRYGALTRNNNGEAVGAIVMMLKGENSGAVIKNVKKRIEQIRKTLPEGIEIHPFLDRTKLVNKAISTVSKNLIEGALIVVFVLVLLLGNLRAGLIVSSVIPLSMLFAISMMHSLGISGNLMSLGAIDFGLIVDGAVIIVEATLHHIGSRKAIYLLSPQQMDNYVYESASKIRKSAAFGEIIILIVYLPILALTGIEGKMFRPMALTVSFAILGAFVLSLTYVPMMSALFLNRKINDTKNISYYVMRFFRSIYVPAREYVFKKKVIVLAGSTFAVVLSLLLFLRMGGEFIPSLDEGDFAIETRLNAGSSISQTIEVSLKAADILMKRFPEVKEVIGKIGSSEIPTDPMPMEACDLMVILQDREEWVSASTREALAEKMKAALEEIPGVNFGFMQPIQMRFNELMTGVKQDVAIKIFGPELDTLKQLSEKLGTALLKIEGVKDLYIEQQTGLPQISVKCNREKMERYGITVENINQVVNTAFAGRVAGMIYENEKRFELVLRVDERKRQNIEHIKSLFVPTPSAQQIPLEQLADIAFVSGPSQIQHDEGKRRIIVAFNVRGRDVESVVNQIQTQVEPKLKMPAGYSLSYGGQFQNLIEAKARLSIAVPMALLLIFVLLYFTFHSVKQSILIFTSIPFSAVGGVCALYLRGMPFSISAGVGFIALFGVAVLNGIVLISEFNRLKKQGYRNVYNIVRLGTETRLRPVIMTALVASLGFLPMAISTDAGAEVQKPLATVVIGGLVSATLLTLFVLPVLYIYSEKSFGIKMNKSLQIAGVLFISAVFSSQTLKAQDKITLEDAIKKAHEKNQLIISARHGVAYQKSLKGTSTDIGKTNATLMYGQYNSYYNDNNITITQVVPSPITMHRQAQLHNAYIRYAEQSLSATQSEIEHKVKMAYYNLLYYKTQMRMLARLDTLYSLFLKASTARLQSGETSALEKATAESQLYEVRAKIISTLADIKIYETELKTLINSDTDVTSADTVMTKKILTLKQDSSRLSNNPLLQALKQQIVLANATKLFEKSKLMPDVTISYFNQSLYGTVHYRYPDRYAQANTRFHGINLGVSFPLWIKPQLHKISAHKISVLIAEAQYNAYKKNLEGEYETAYQNYIKFKNHLEYYEWKALPTARHLEENALKNYKAGNIGYMEFFHALSRSIEIEQAYWETMNKYNQSVLYIEYLSGQKY